MSKFVLALFITGRTHSAERAIANLRRICRLNQEECELKIIDLLENPQVAEELRILATPTLIREMPLPHRRVIGDLSDVEKVMNALDLAGLGQTIKESADAAE